MRWTKEVNKIVMKYLPKCSNNERKQDVNDEDLDKKEDYFRKQNRD